MSPEQLDGIINVLYKARTDHQVRLRFGVRHRHGLIEAIQAADPKATEPADYIKHPRYQWVKSTRELLLNTMGEQAKNYTKDRPYDAISLADMTDVVEGMLMWLKEAQNS